MLAHHENITAVVNHYGSSLTREQPVKRHRVGVLRKQVTCSHSATVANLLNARRVSTRGIPLPLSDAETQGKARSKFI